MINPIFPPTNNSSVSNATIQRLTERLMKDIHETLKVFLNKTNNETNRELLKNKLFEMLQDYYPEHNIKFAVSEGTEPNTIVLTPENEETKKIFEEFENEI